MENSAKLNYSALRGIYVLFSEKYPYLQAKHMCHAYDY